MSNTKRVPAASLFPGDHVWIDGKFHELATVRIFAAGDVEVIRTDGARVALTGDVTIPTSHTR